MSEFKRKKSQIFLTFFIFLLYLKYLFYIYYLMVIEEKNKSLFQESLSSELEKMGTNSGKESSFEQEKS